MSEPDFSITDPRPLAASAPYTFFLPSTDETFAVSQGDLVKLLFDYPHETEKWAAERMWVIVESGNGDELQGVLDNEPDEPTSPLKLGQKLAFRRHQILAIEWGHPGKAPQPKMRRSYWERCLVDQCVLDGDEPVEYVYREEPEPAGRAEEYHDSGWRIRGRMGDASDADMEKRDVAYVAVGAVLNRDDSWIEWIDAPVGTALMRDFEKGIYVATD